jgi:hypothetical protein
MEFVLFIWLIISVVVGVAANSRGRSGFGWFLISVFLSPILALLFLLVFPPLTHERDLKFDDAELRKNIRRGKRTLLDL